jgi:CheY-like chemotaxis protein
VSLRVLIVDDHTPTVEALGGLLGREGWEVSPCTTAEGALKALAESAFDVIITDFEMPVLMGDAIVRATREQQPHACIVVLSALIDRHAPTLASAGACILAGKPLEYTGVVSELAACRARGGPGESGGCHMRAKPPGGQVVKLGRRPRVED